MAQTYRIVLRKLTLGAATATLAVAGAAGPAGAQKADGGTDGGTLLCTPDSPICVGPITNLGSADGGR